MCICCVHPSIARRDVEKKTVAVCQSKLPEHHQAAIVWEEEKGGSGECGWWLRVRVHDDGFNVFQKPPRQGRNNRFQLPFVQEEETNVICRAANCPRSQSTTRINSRHAEGDRGRRMGEECACSTHGTKMGCTATALT